ncbi:MAG: Rieske (2Fe-2S) protein [Acidobacteria bacterium]|nr:Rieske (2Fe-2S) protein [Acidobacteriota bacterium]
MSFVQVGSLDDLRPGGVMEFRRGSTEVAVCNVDGELFAVDNRCPHRGGPLAMGALHANLLVCPWHGWEFDCVSGVCAFSPAVTLRRYPVEVSEDRSILVDLE